MKKLLFLLLALPTAAFASGAASIWIKPRSTAHDQESLQRGARVFVNYCLNCHGAGYMRYNRMQDFGLTEQQIKDNLLYAAEKPGETMKVAMQTKDAKAWFGAPPPDLSVITRSRGADWVYTYLRSFYRDDTRPTGWNNTVFDKVGMPHVLHELQGQMAPVYRTEKNAEGHDHQVLERLELSSPARSHKLNMTPWSATW
jgi:ubiquinol-cytochrome c reductase cytochrome c1 subunit